MATLFLSRPLQKGEMSRILRGLSKKQQEKVQFWLDKDTDKDQDPQIRIHSNKKTDVAAVKDQLKKIKGVKII